MANTDSQRLLAEYVTSGSEEAFRELVARYLNLVYSSALRLVGGDTHLAEDVTQTVFTDLARKAPNLPAAVMLGGWLHRHTCFVASKVIRSERRRKLREQRAVEMNSPSDHSQPNIAQLAPVLDGAINELRATDRTAILLRFFEQQDLKAVGVAIGCSENAAQKRISRALEQLRGLLKARGVVLSTTALGTVLAADAVGAAPAALIASVSSAALAAGAATGTVTAMPLLKLFLMTKLKTGIIAAIAVASAGTTLLIQQQAQARLRAGEQSLREQSDKLKKARGEQEHLADLSGQPEPRNDLNDLLRLRTEAASLRAGTNALAALAAENERLRLKTSNTNTQSALATKEKFNALAFSKLNSGKAWALVWRTWAYEHQGRFPSSFEEAAPLLPEEARGEDDLHDLDQFDIVYQGSFNDLTNPAKVIVFREKQAWFANGKWAKAYAFADGHSEIHVSADGNFDRWEQDKLIPANQ